MESYILIYHENVQNEKATHYQRSASMMSLKKVNEEEILKMSMIELANLILADQKEEMNFLDLYEKIAELKKLSEADKERYLSQFYTDLNIDGRFIALGSNVWGLKRWFPVSQTSEKALADARRRDADALEDEIDDEFDEEYEEDDELDFDSYDEFIED